MNDFHKQTQAFSTWGDKLLQHASRLAEIQVDRKFRPITLQLAPTEACDSDCPFCSVALRPAGLIRWDDIVCGLDQFSELGCKSVELTGGGNPTLYRQSGKTINDIIDVCASHNLLVGVITNSENISRHLTLKSIDTCSWVRVSLAKLDEGFGPDDYDLNALGPKLGLSYIVHSGTTEKTFHAIKAVLDNHPSAKFVRIAADCLTDDSMLIKHKWGELVQQLDPRFFIKEINDNYHPFPGGCWVGMLRPYWTSTGIYICTSHVLKERTYLPEYRLCGVDSITETWDKMNEDFAQGKAPYAIDVSHCGHCYYYNNNQLLNAVIHELPDKDFA